MTALIRSAALAVALVAFAGAARAQEPIKIGIIMPMTGGLSAIGRQVKAGVDLFVKQNGDNLLGRQVEVIFRDDAGKPEESQRIARELIVNEKVDLLGAGLTPSALAIAPLATSAKIATIVMVSGTRIVTDRSPYLVRTSFTLGSQSAIMAGWATRNGSRRAVIVHSDWAPGAEAAEAFTTTFTSAGGEIADTLKVPLANPDFAPFLQRARDARPDTIFVFVPTGQAGTFARQFVERGMDKAGIKLIGTGDITDDDDLPGMGDAVLGTVTAGVYSPAHDTNVNRNFVAAFMADNAFRPNHIALGGYDGMRLIYDTIKKAGVVDGEKMVAAMKGAAWESPRGPISIDPATREIVQNIYIRRVEKRNGELVNAEFATFPAVSPATTR
jgi:branched-chain amino acid transport system substrate-binding protein